MARYRVTWEIDVFADGPVRAAEEAFEIMQDPDTTATCFLVKNEEGGVEIVDVRPEGRNGVYHSS